jgi:hypothetical protein
MKSLFNEPSPVKISKCLIFHDESKGVKGDDIWAHVLFFVPEPSEPILLQKLWQTRRNCGCINNRLHFTGMSGSKISSADGSKAIKSWLELGVEALKNKDSSIFKPALNCKLGVIFFSAPLNTHLYGGNRGEKKIRYFETVLRMLLKGCAHALYDTQNKLVIKGIITDGFSWHRSLNEFRIIQQLTSEVRSYVAIDNNASIEEISSNHKSDVCSDKDKAQFLQLTDLFLGSVINSCYRNLVFGCKKEIIIRPIKEMLDKRKRGKFFLKSSHYRSFNLSIAKVINGRWNFQTVYTKDIVFEDNQLKLFDFK